MSATVQIEIPPESLDFLRRITNRPGVLAAIGREMDHQNQLTIGHISSVRMRGNNNRPFPVSEHKLGIRSAQAVKSLDATPAQIVGDAVVTSMGTKVGSNVKHLKVHEFGGTFTVQKKAGSVRLRTGPNGNLLRQGKNGKLAIFAKKTHADSRVRVKTFEGSTYTVTYPERAPIRYGIQDRAAAYGTGIGQAIIAFWKGGQA